MGRDSAIEWTDHTFNPWVGCQRVSPGCENCYAEAYDKRVGGVPKKQRPDQEKPLLRWGPKAPRTRTGSKVWGELPKINAEALAAGRRARVFCASLADVFEDREELVPWRAELFELIEATPAIDWQLLTKRPENLPGFLPLHWIKRPRPNVWLGTTVEDQKRADLRIAQLLAVPAQVRFLSVEPMIEAINLGLFDCFEFKDGHKGKASGIDWVICGGESGPGAREFDLSWAHDLQRQCRSAKVAFFMKQLGARPESADPECGDDQVYELADSHGGDWDEWPSRAEALKVRDFPARAIT